MLAEKMEEGVAGSASIMKRRGQTRKERRVKDIGNRGIRELRTVRTVAAAADARSLSLGDQRPFDEKGGDITFARAASPTSPTSGHKGAPRLSCVTVRVRIM